MLEDFGAVGWWQAFPCGEDVEAVACAGLALFVLAGAGLTDLILAAFLIEQELERNTGHVLVQDERAVSASPITGWAMPWATSSTSPSSLLQYRP